MSATLTQPQPSARFTAGDAVEWKGIACTVESVMLHQGEGAEFHQYFEPVYCESDLVGVGREAA